MSEVKESAKVLETAENPVDSSGTNSVYSSEEKQSGDNKEKTGIKKYILGGIVSTYLLALILIYGGMILGNIIVYLPLYKAGLYTDDHPIIVTAVSYLAFIGIWIITLAFIAIRKKKKEYVRKILPKIVKRSFIMFLIGFFCVGGLNAICIVAALISGDISEYFYAFDIIPLLFLLISVYIQSSAEELVCRGFMYRRIEACYKHPAVAIIGNAMFFAIMHLGNDGVTAIAVLNILFSGILFSLLVYYTGSMSIAFAAHAGWNYCQSIVFGLPNSGNVFPYSLLKLETATARDSFFYNCNFGVESTWFALIVLVAASVAVFVLGQKGILKKAEYDAE